MNQKKRMAGTLSCLMVAMSATAVLLGYMNPARDQATPEQVERILLAASNAVADDVTLRPQRWQDIEVLAVPEKISGGALLAATRDDGVWHFHIGADGIPVRGRSWGRQESASSAPRSILIHLTRPYASEDFLPLQVIGVRALVSSIYDNLRQSADSLPVRFVANG